MLLLLIYLLFELGNCQVRILQPSSLASRFQGSLIRGSTAAFGTPYWGEQLIGKLAFAPSKGNAYCTDTDYELPPLVDDVEPVGEDTDNLRHFPRVVVVRRGQCHFAIKVKVAQDSKQASAVIVVDNANSGRTPDEVRAIIMADDGLGSKIRIPSILISDQEGSQLISSLESGTDVIVELAWDIPNESIVEVDDWMSPALSQSVNFLGAFSVYARALRHSLDFRPHFWIFSLPSDANSMCLDTGGRFCGMSPDWHDLEVSGKQTVQESLRQLCLWHVTKDVNLTLPKSGEYSEVWWKYVERVGERCLRPDVTSPTYSSRFTAECSEDLMTEVGADLRRVKSCFEGPTGMALLTNDLYNHAWSPTAMMINDARFAGPLDAFVVARAVCTGFSKEPKECELLKSRHIHDVLFHRDGDGSGYVLGESLSFHRGGVAWWVYFLSVLGASLAGCLVVIAGYRHWLAKQLRNELRYEVFEEVKSQMGPSRSFQQQPMSVRTPNYQQPQHDQSLSAAVQCAVAHATSASGIGGGGSAVGDTGDDDWTVQYTRPLSNAHTEEQPLSLELSSDLKQ